MKATTNARSKICLIVDGTVEEFQTLYDVLLRGAYADAPVRQEIRRVIGRAIYEQMIITEPDLAEQPVFPSATPETPTEDPLSETEEPGKPLQHPIRRQAAEEYLRLHGCPHEVAPVDYSTLVSIVWVLLIDLAEAKRKLAEEPGKPSKEKVTTAAAFEYMQAQGHSFKKTVYSTGTVIGLLQPPLTELVETINELSAAKRELEAQATAPRGVLKWRGVGIPEVQAKGSYPEAGAYGLYYRHGSDEWEAWRAGTKLHAGTLRECMAWCEALERDPDAIPFGIAEKGRTDPPPDWWLFTDFAKEIGCMVGEIINGRAMALDGAKYDKALGLLVAALPLLREATVLSSGKNWVYE